MLLGCAEGEGCLVLFVCMYNRCALLHHAIPGLEVELRI